VGERAAGLARTTPEVVSLGGAATASFGDAARTHIERLLGARMQVTAPGTPGSPGSPSYPGAPDTATSRGTTSEANGAGGPRGARVAMVAGLGGMLGGMRIDVDNIEIRPKSRDDSPMRSISAGAATTSSGRAIPGTISPEAAEARRKAQEEGQGGATVRRAMSFQMASGESPDNVGPIIELRAPLLKDGAPDAPGSRDEERPMLILDLAWNAQQQAWQQVGMTIIGVEPTGGMRTVTRPAASREAAPATP